MAQEDNKSTLEERQKAANPGGLLTEEQALQVEALKKGASEEEASLGGKLGAAREVPSESPTGAPTAPLEEEVAFQEVKPLTVARVDRPGPVRQGQPGNAIVKSAMVDKQKRIPLASLVASTPEPMDERELKSKASELAMLKTAIDPLVRPEEAYRESREQLRSSGDVESLFQSYQNQWAQKEQEILAEVMVGQVNSGNASPDEAAEVIEQSNQIQEEYQGPLGREKMMVEAYSDASFDQQMMDTEVAQNYAWSKVKNLADENGTLSRLWDYTTEFLAPDFIKDSNDLVGNSLFDTKRDLTNLVNAYQQLPPSEQPAAFDDIWERAVEAYDGNTVALSGFVNLLHSTTPGEDFATDAAWDVADIAGYAIAPLSFAARTARGIGKGVKLSRKMKDMGADDEAAAMHMLNEDSSVTNPAEAVAGSKTDTAITASPYKMENYIFGIGSDDGLAYRIRSVKDQQAKQILREVSEDVQKPFEHIRRDDFTISLDALSKQEKERAVGTFAEKLANRFDTDDVAYEEVGVVSQNNRGFTFEYKLNGEPITEQVFWTRNDAGVFEGVNSGFKKRLSTLPGFNKLVSPEMKLDAVSDNLVQDVTFGGLQASRVKKDLRSIARSLDEGLSSKERQSVDELLVAGDEEQKVFSLDELRNTGVELRTGTRTYSDKEIKNYYKKVALNQELWSLRNHAVKRELEFMGAKRISYTTPDESEEAREFIGIPKSSFQGISDELTENRPVLAPQLTDKLYMNGSQLNLKKLKEDGFQAVELQQKYKVNDKEVKYAIIRDSGFEGRASISDLPDEVLNRIDGYAPRVYEKGYFFVKDVNSGETIRAFQNSANAKKFREKEMQRIQSMTPEEREAAGLTKDVQYQVFRDRELSRLEAITEDANQYGGLFTGARKRTPLIVDETGERPVRLSWGQSTDRYIDSVADTMPLNEYRMALKQRFINSVNELYKMDGREGKFGLDQSWLDEPIVLSDRRTADMLEETRNYLKQQFSSWSRDEKRFNSFMMDIGEIMGGKSERFIASHFGHSDPMKLLHSSSFHAHLGWFNPRQLYVQAQNAALAISMFPQHGMQAASKALAMRAFMRLPDDQLETMISRFDPVPGVSSKELAEDIRQFKRSGMESSIMRVADYDAAADGFTPGTLKRVRQLSRKGLMFYENGELFSRLTAWNIAKRNWKAQNPNRAIDDTSIREITDETFRLHMNLQRENAATWQTNILRVPTQFMQVQAKFTEKVLGGLLFGRTRKAGWTRKEAASVAVGQIALYGTLGVPIAEQAVNSMADKLGVTPDKLREDYPMAAEAIQDGAMGAFFETLGFQNQMGGDTASLVAGYDENVVSGLISAASRLVTNDYGGDSAEELFFGPSLNVVRRTGDAMIDGWNRLVSVAKVPTAENAGKNMLETMSDFAAITSTWSNARKLAHYHHGGAFYSKAGKVLLDEEDLQGTNMRTLVLKGMGLPLDAEASYWSLVKKNREISQYIGDAKEDYKKVLREVGRNGNMDHLKAMQAHLLAPFSEQEKREIITDAFNDIVKQEGKSDLDRELYRHMNYILRSGGRIPAKQDLNNIYQAREPEEAENPTELEVERNR